FTWTEFTNVNGESNMTGCWVFGPNDIYAINGDLHRFDGAAWTRIIVHDTKGLSYEYGLSGCSILGFSDNDMWFIDGGLALHYIGNATVVRYNTYAVAPVAAHSAWGTSSTDLFVVGDSGTILHFNGTTWTKMSSPTKKNLQEISGTSDKSIWACGYNSSTGGSVLLHYDGSSWSIDPLSNKPVSATGGFLSVWTADSGNGHTVSATSGSIVYRKTDDGAWRNTDSGKVPNYALGGYVGLGLRGNGSNDLFAVGPWGLVIHWNGKSWYRYDQYFQPNNSSYITGGASVHGNTACVVGVKNGTSWVLVGQRQ
ncbi:MAG: hypothetical protein Q8922_11775, partial [Bacteroidota bacterium]|nr:hypothetical protein [Bacteroidota bacterium]